MSDRMYNVCNFLQRGTFRLFADISVRGVDNVPEEGPLIVVANHQSNMDPPLLAPLIPRRLKFLAKESLFKNSIASWFLHAWGGIPGQQRDARREGYALGPGVSSTGRRACTFPGRHTASQGNG